MASALEQVLRLSTIAMVQGSAMHVMVKVVKV